MTDHAIPLAAGSVPLLGHAPRLVRDPLGFLTTLASQGPLLRVRAGRHRMVLVCDPELAGQVFRDDRTFDKDSSEFRFLRTVMGNGLLSCAHRDHRRQRRMCQAAFQRARMPAYVQVMAEDAEDVAGSWRGGEPLDVSREMGRLSVPVLMESMFGASPPSRLTLRMVQDVSVIDSGILRQTIFPAPFNRLFLTGNRRFQQSLTRLRQTAHQIVAQRHAAVDTGQTDLLSLLCQSGDRSGKREISDEEVADQVVTFLLAGIQTTADTLTWALHLLARHPRVQRKLQVEADRVLAGEPAASEHLASLGDHAAVLTETLRMYPPVWHTARTVTADTSLGGTRLPAGTVLVVSPYLIHRRGDLYQDPGQFCPERWERTKPDRAHYLPFGAGARKCIGDTFAFSEMVLALAAITRRWWLQPVTARPPRVRAGVTLRAHGLRLRPVART